MICLLLVLAIPLAVAMPVVPMNSVAAHNDALGSSLQGQTDNVYGLSVHVPTIYDPLRFFNLDVASVYPSINDVVYPRSDLRAVLGYSLNYSPRVVSGDLSGCGHTLSTLVFQNQINQLELVTRLDGVSKSVPNPSGIQTLPFSLSDYEKAHALEVDYQGGFQLNYQLTNQTVVCTVACGKSGCTTLKSLVTNIYPRSFSYGSSSSVLTYRLLNTSLLGVLFEPYFGKRTLRTPWLDAYFLANASVAAWQVQKDNVTVAAETYQRYRVQTDPRNVQSVRAEPILETQSVQAFFVEKLFTPFFADGRKVRLSDDVTGNHDFGFSFMDLFGNAWSKNATVETQQATTLSLNVTPQTGSAATFFHASAGLFLANGTGLANQPLRFLAGNQQKTATTDAFGLAFFDLPLSPGVQTVEAHFDGVSGLPDAFARRQVVVLSDDPQPLRVEKFSWVFVPILLILGLALSKRI